MSEQRRPKEGLVTIGLYVICLSITIAAKFWGAALCCFFYLLLFTKEKCILPVLFTIPIVETVLEVASGITITKIIGALLLMFFLVQLLRVQTIRFDKNTIFLSLFFATILIGFANAMFIGEYHGVPGGDAKTILAENVKGVFPLMLFAIVFYQYLLMLPLPIFEYGIYALKNAIPIGVAIVSMYFLTHPQIVGSWYNVVLRLSFQHADPNEFAVMLAALSVFSWRLIFFGKSFLERLLGIASVLTAYSAIALTYSRTGAICALASPVIVGLGSPRMKLRKLIISGATLSLLVLVLCQLGIIDPSGWYERFAGQRVSSLSELTALRVDIWANALRYFLARPLIGYGGTEAASLWVSLDGLGRPKVMHSLFLQILIQYGLIGMVAFLLLLKQAVLGYYKVRKVVQKNWRREFLSTPFLMLYILLLGALALSWLRREIVWFTIILCLAISQKIKVEVQVGEGR